MVQKMIQAKKIIRKTFENNFYFFILLAATILLTYWEIISNDVILSYDDNVLLTSISKVQSIKHYFFSIHNGLILDFQPIRDLSYLLDFKIKILYSSYSFHFTNTVIWIFLCYLVRSIFLLHSPRNYYVIGLLTLLYALSPISANSVAWIAARKHILATFFIVYATYLTIKHKDNLTNYRAITITFLYFLSCYSQPINSLWIIWFSYFIYSTKPQLNSHFYKTLAPNIIVFLSSISINFYYYKVIYTKNISLMSKFGNYKTFDFGDPLLALGRYFYQCLNPFSALPTSHYPGSWENLVGLFTLVFFLAYCFKKIKKGSFTLISPLIYFFYPLILVTVNMTNIFASDTYLLNSSIGFYWCVLIISENFKFQKLLTYTLGAYLLVISCYNLHYIKIFLNENELWIYSYKKEATPQAAIITSSTYIKQKRFYESFLLIEEVQNRWPNQPYLPQIIAENLFYNPNIDSELKIKKISEIKPAMPSTYLYLTILYGYDNNPTELSKVLYLIFNDPIQFNMEFRGNEEKIAAIFIYTCEYFKYSQCRNHIDNFKKNSLYKDWNEDLINTYLEQLRRKPSYQINI